MDITLETAKKLGLTKDEFEIIKKHTTMGYETIKDQSIKNDIKTGVLFHHEKILVYCTVITSICSLCTA